MGGKTTLISSKTVNITLCSQIHTSGDIMNESTFVYWLQGFVEIANTDTISEKPWQIIKDHLKLVFDKKTPDRDGWKPELPSSPIIDWSKFKAPVITC